MEGGKKKNFDISLQLIKTFTMREYLNIIGKLCPQLFVAGLANLTSQLFYVNEICEAPVHYP